MEHGTRVNGVSVRLKGRGHFTMRTVMCSKVSSGLIKLTGKESTSTRMVKGTTASGLMMSSKELELKLSLMEASTKANFMVARNMAEASTSGLMAPSTVESGETIRSMGTGFMTGQMVADTRVNGVEINSTIEEYILGPMDESTMGNTWMTRSMVGVSTSGQMANNTKDIGIMENSMVKAGLQTQQERAESEFG